MAIYGTLGDIDLTSTDYPSVQPTLDLNFAKVKLLDPRITFYRDSLATYTDSLGIIRTVPANTPRFDHNPATGESLGLLVEEARTNFLLRSEEFDNAAWGKTNVTVSTNAIIAPNGTTTADTLTFTGANSYSYQVVTTPTISIGQIVTYSVWVWSPSKASIGVRIADTATGSISGFQAVSLTGTAQRVSVAVTATSATSQWSVGLDNRTGNGGDQISGNVIAWGGQLEQGSFPTSYIPTTTATVTRAADIPFIEGTNFSSFYDSTGGTVFVESYLYDYSGGVISFGTSNYTQSLGISASGAPPGQFYIAGNYNTANAYTGSSTYLSNQRNKICVGISSNGLKVCANGGSVNSSSGGTPIFTNFDRVGLGGNIAWDKTYTTQGLSHIASLKYYRTFLTDAQIKNLTS